jgi:hypothetical protein
LMYQDLTQKQERKLRFAWTELQNY